MEGGLLFFRNDDGKALSHVVQRFDELPAQWGEQAGRTVFDIGHPSFQSEFLEKLASLEFISNGQDRNADTHSKNSHMHTGCYNHVKGREDFHKLERRMKILIYRDPRSMLVPYETADHFSAQAVIVRVFRYALTR